ncbi:MAG: four helix bundle protein [Chloroflexota bacterium]|nr:four helix bundle protein [Chloroflexota bacterium]
MGRILHFQQLDVWRESHELVLMVYRVTKKFPGDERFGLISQMRRAAVSIPANIAEGFKRHGIRDKIRFYNISEGSLEELKYDFPERSRTLTPTHSSSAVC